LERKNLKEEERWRIRTKQGRVVPIIAASGFFFLLSRERREREKRDGDHQSQAARAKDKLHC